MDPRFPFVSFHNSPLSLVYIPVVFPGIVGLILCRQFPIVVELLVQVTSRVCFDVKRKGFKSTTSK